ncbi:hypothetical protein ACJIZ3_017014 [Penstemon smallii]|uniref:Uncharacterized protein n=1 Tax=Penstemon smallii TaxID=265156 RepID=A0ABD3SUD4_9LAMI
MVLQILSMVMFSAAVELENGSSDIAIKFENMIRKCARVDKLSSELDDTCCSLARDFDFSSLCLSSHEVLSAQQLQLPLLVLRHEIIRSVVMCNIILPIGSQCIA